MPSKTPSKAGESTNCGSNPSPFADLLPTLSTCVFKTNSPLVSKPSKQQANTTEHIGKPILHRHRLRGRRHFSLCLTNKSLHLVSQQIDNVPTSYYYARISSAPTRLAASHVSVRWSHDTKAAVLLMLQALDDGNL